MSPEQQIALWEIVNRVQRAIYNDLSDLLRPHGLSPDQWRILNALEDGHGHTLSEIVNVLGINISALSKNIDRMSTRALVFRRQNEVDQRCVQVFLSDDGIALLALTKPLVTDSIHFEQRLSQHEQQRFYTALGGTNQQYA